MPTPTRLVISPYNHHLDAALSVTSAAASFPVTDTQSSTRDQMWRSTSTATNVITGVLPAAAKASMLYIGQHLCHGGTVQLQLYSDAGASVLATPYAGFAATAIGPNVALSNPTDWGLSNAQLATDLLYYDSNFVAYFGSLQSIRSYKLTFTGTPNNGNAYWQVGSIHIGPHFESGVNPDFGLKLGWRSNATVSRSVGGSRRATASAKWRRLEGELNYIQEADRAAFLDIMAYMGRARVGVMSVFPGQGGRLERDYTVQGTFVEEDFLAYSNFVTRSTKFAFEEV